MSDDTIRVRISYSPDPYEIGTVRELPADEARILIREGRAKACYDDDIEGTQATTVAPSAQSSPARQARRSQTPASTSEPAEPVGVKHTNPAAD